MFKSSHELHKQQKRKKQNQSKQAAQAAAKNDSKRASTQSNKKPANNYNQLHSSAWEITAKQSFHGNIFHSAAAAALSQAHVKGTCQITTAKNTIQQLVAALNHDAELITA